MDVIAVDIGNSRIALAAYVKDDFGASERLSVGQLGDLPRVLRELRASCGEQPLGARTVPVVVSSVNAGVLEVLEQATAEALDQRILLIGRDVPLPIKIAVEQPESVGTDRLLTASAAFDMLGGALVVADFGTATTIDCVSRQGIFLGGAIMPGLHLAAQALKEHTSALPQAEIKLPEGEYGTNTIGAIQQGIYYGAIGALRELVERYASQLGQWPHVVVTGGYGPMIAERCDFVDSVVPNLCLTGVYLTYVRFRVGQEGQG